MEDRPLRHLRDPKISQERPRHKTWRVLVGGVERLVLEGKAVIGRTDDAEIRLDDEMLSRHHALLTVVDGQLTVRDLKSRNGVYVNGVRVEVSVLGPDDVVKVGTTEITFGPG